jgi:hypothetical protein
MNGQGGYQQIPCARCGQVVWIEMTTRQGVCQSCGNINYMQAQPMAMGAPPPMQGYPQAGPGYPNQMPYQGSVPMSHAPMPGMQMPQGAMSQAPMPTASPAQPVPSNPAAMYQNPRKHVAKGVAGAVVVAVVGGGGYFVKNKFGNPGPGKLSYRSLHIDPSKAEPDALITSVASTATRWNRDATWWAVNVHGVRPDGTIDLKSGATAQVTYISPSRVQSMAKTRRKDSIKKFSFGPLHITHAKKWEPTKAWKEVSPPGMPACAIADLTAHLVSKGFKTGTLHVSFDPQFAFAVDAYAWRVQNEAQPELNGWFSMLDCSLLKADPAK